MSGTLAEWLPVETARTRLRRLHAADLDAFHAYRSDPEVGRYQGWYVMDRPHALRFLQEMSTVAELRPDDWVQIGIAARADDTLLGDIGLYLAPDGGEVELGFSLAAHCQGRGFATEAVAAAIRLAFDSCDARRIRAICDVRNERSLRLLQRLGFAPAGRQQSVVRGESCDELVFERWREPPVAAAAAAPLESGT